MEHPENFQEYADRRFGFSVWMPRRFEILDDTVDPLARTLRGLYDIPEEERAETQARLPLGFWDPSVIGEMKDGTYQPLRFLEWDAITGRVDAPDEARIAEMREEIRGFMPETLASAKMPGYEYLGASDMALGPLPAIAFEYRWDGPRPGKFGGDHGMIVWAMHERTMFQVYHHCSVEQWEQRREELDQILASFELIEAISPVQVFTPGEGDEAAAGEGEGEAVADEPPASAGAADEPPTSAE